MEIESCSGVTQQATLRLNKLEGPFFLRNTGPKENSCHGDCPVVSASKDRLSQKRKKPLQQNAKIAGSCDRDDEI